MRIGLDLDGCLVDWVEAICEELSIDPAKVGGWDSIFTATGMEPKTLFGWCRKLRMFARAKPREGGIEAVDALKAAGHDIQFITARPVWADGETRCWLAEQFGPEGWRDLDSRTHIMQGVDKSIVPCDIYLDDSPHVLRALRKKRLRVVRFERPWNRTCKAWWATVKSWPEFVELIEAQDG